MSMPTYTQMITKSMYMFVSMLVCVPRAPVTKEARRQHKIPGARVIDNCEPPRGAIRDSTPQGKERDPTKVRSTEVPRRPVHHSS